MLASVLRHAGYRTGLFTSPHLTDVRERIQIDGELIGQDDLAALMAEIKPAVEELESTGEPPTFFEVGTALGFLHFLRKECDIAVIEVGLGGRFDSTNVITPLVSIITSISLDHTQMLGETVEQIAFEKAGIIKPGVPVISGVTDPRPRAVIEKIAAERGAPLVQRGVGFHYRRATGSEFTYYDCPSQDTLLISGETRFRVMTALPGEHQRANTAVALAVVVRLRESGFSISDWGIWTGLGSIDWPARCEEIESRPRVVLDCAHNVASVEALIETLGELYQHGWQHNAVLIFAASADKDIFGMFRVLAPHFRRFYLTRYQQSTRAVPPEELAAMLPPETERVICPTPADAWKAAVADATPETLVVIAGSVFLAGELRPLLVQASGGRQPPGFSYSKEPGG